MSHESLLIFFKDLKTIFDDNGIGCWLIYGALLGMVREGKLLEGDRDIDIAIWDESLSNVEDCLDLFHGKNISVHFTESGHVSFNRDGEHISAMVFSKEDGKAVRSTYTHIRKFKRTGDGVIHYKGLDVVTQMLKYLRWLLSDPRYVGDPPRGVSKNMQGLFLYFFKRHHGLRMVLKGFVEIILSCGCKYYTEVIPVRYFLELSSIWFYDVMVNAPSDTEGYLVCKYGRDWRIPKKDYIYYIDSKAEVSI